MTHLREPTLDEMLADPVILAIMARDGVSQSTVRRLIAELRRARHRGEWPASDPIEVPAGRC
jgi:hypothetical protein